MVGVIVSMPLAVRPLTALIAAPMKLRGLPGELAKQNAMRNTRRTASTAAALMIGLTLVVSMSVFASSLKDSFGEVIGDKTNADLFLTASSCPGPGLQPVGRRGRRGRDGRRRDLRHRVGPGPLRRCRLELLGHRPGQCRRADEPQPVARVHWATSAPTASSSPRPRPSPTGGRSATRSRPTSPPPAPMPCASPGSTPSKGWIADNFILSLEAQNAFAGPQLVDLGPGEHRRRRRQGRRPGRDRGGPGRPPRRQGAGPGGVRGGGQRLHRQPAHLRHGDAAPRGRDRAARHRQHPGPVGVRAHS